MADLATPKQLWVLNRSGWLKLLPEPGPMRERVFWKQANQTIEEATREKREAKEKTEETQVEALLRELGLSGDDGAS